MKILIKFLWAPIILILIAGCQKMDRPSLGDYPTDSNPPGGPLSFFVAFNGTTDNPRMNAVDSVRASFPTDNPLAAVDGISGKAVQGEKYKYIKYANANDFASKAGSFTVAFWQKKGLIRTEHIFSLPAVSDYHWSGASMFLLQEGGESDPILKFFVRDAGDEKWFEWVPWGPAGSVKGIYDNQWHHLAFVYDGTTSKMTLYVDGAAKTSIEWSGHGNVKLEPSKITALKIGAGPQEFTAAEVAAAADDWLKNSWTGAIDQFRMYTTALTAAEVSALFNSKN